MDIKYYTDNQINYIIIVIILYIMYEHIKDYKKISDELNETKKRLNILEYNLKKEINNFNKTTKVNEEHIHNIISKFKNQYNINEVHIHNLISELLVQTNNQIEDLSKEFELNKEQINYLSSEIKIEKLNEEHINNLIYELKNLYDSKIREIINKIKLLEERKNYIRVKTDSSTYLGMEEFIDINNNIIEINNINHDIIYLFFDDKIIMTKHYKLTELFILINNFKKIKEIRIELTKLFDNKEEINTLINILIYLTYINTNININLIITSFQISYNIIDIFENINLENISKIYIYIKIYTETGQEIKTSHQSNKKLLFDKNNIIDNFITNEKIKNKIGKIIDYRPK